MTMTFDSKTRKAKYKRELEVLTIEDLQVDETYQRGLDQNLVERILQEYDPMAADAITVSSRKNGKYYIVNGQHRAAAAALAGETEILAFVYYGLTIEAEADLRLKANNRRSDSAMERFHAQIAKKDVESLAIVSMLERFDTHVNQTANKHTGVNCISTLEALYRIDGGDILEKTLQAIQDAFGDVAGEQATTPVINGIAWFLRQHGRQIQVKSFTERIGKAGVDDIMRKARNHKAVSGGTNWINLYRALVEIYNFHRPLHTRIEPKFTRYSLEGGG